MPEDLGARNEQIAVCEQATRHNCQCSRDGPDEIEHNSRDKEEQKDSKNFDRGRDSDGRGLFIFNEDGSLIGDENCQSR